MGRPTKQNLDYFSIDQSFFSDKKFARVTLRHGIKARMVYLYILELVYFDKGYFVEFSEDTCAQIALEMSAGEPGIDMDVIETVIRDEVKAGLFDERLFNEAQILTSAGIQDHYYFVSKDRKCNFVNFDYWVLSEERMRKITTNCVIYEEYLKYTAEKLRINPDENDLNKDNPSETGVNPSKSEKNPRKTEINPESKVKESKVKESKGKESKDLSEPDGSLSPNGESTPPPIDFAKLIQYWNDHVTGMKKINSIANQRKKHVTARVNEVGKAEFFRVIESACNSSFLNGNSKKGWKATFDWCMNPNNFVKIQEGNYDDDDHPEPQKEKTLAEMLADGTLKFDENGDLIDDSGAFGARESPPIDIEYEVINDDAEGIAGTHEPVSVDVCEF